MLAQCAARLVGRPMTANGSTNDDDYDDGESCFSNYFKTVCVPQHFRPLRGDALNERVMIYETLQWRRRGAMRRCAATAAGLQCIVCPLFLHTGIATRDDHAVT